MVPHTAQLEASGQTMQFLTILCCQQPDLSSEQKQLMSFCHAPLHFIDALNCRNVDTEVLLGSESGGIKGQSG